MGEADVRKIGALPWPLIREWCAYFAIEAHDREDRIKRKEIEAEAEAGLQRWKRDPLARRYR